MNMMIVTTKNDQDNLIWVQTQTNPLQLLQTNYYNSIFYLLIIRENFVQFAMVFNGKDSFPKILSTFPSVAYCSS